MCKMDRWWCCCEIGWEKKEKEGDYVDDYEKEIINNEEEDD